MEFLELGAIVMTERYTLFGSPGNELQRFQVSGISDMELLDVCASRCGAIAKR